MPKHEKISMKPAVRRDGMREGELVSFEAVIRSETGESMFDSGKFLTADNIKSFIPKAEAAQKAARILHHPFPSLRQPAYRQHGFLLFP